MSQVTDRTVAVERCGTLWSVVERCGTLWNVVERQSDQINNSLRGKQSRRCLLLRHRLNDICLNGPQQLHTAAPRGPRAPAFPP
ncbi:uncharacterized protein V6R79_002918 [Siganus canaliculatus]